MWIILKKNKWKQFLNSMKMCFEDALVHFLREVIFLILHGVLIIFPVVIFVIAYIKFNFQPKWNVFFQKLRDFILILNKYLDSSAQIKTYHLMNIWYNAKYSRTPIMWLDCMTPPLYDSPVAIFFFLIQFW